MLRIALWANLDEDNWGPPTTDVKDDFELKTGVSRGYLKR